MNRAIRIDAPHTVQPDARHQTPKGPPRSREDPHGPHAGPEPGGHRRGLPDEEGDGQRGADRGDHAHGEQPPEAQPAHEGRRDQYVLRLRRACARVVRLQGEPTIEHANPMRHRRGEARTWRMYYDIGNSHALPASRQAADVANAGPLGAWRGEDGRGDRGVRAA